MVYLCRACGLAFEAAAERLVELKPLTASPTTKSALPPVVRYLAVWRFAASVEVRSKDTRSGAQSEHVWDGVKRAAAPGPPFLYVPAFAFGRLVVQQLGAGLVEAQPVLSLEERIPWEVPLLSLLHEGVVSVDAGKDERGPGFGTVSPVVLGRRDAEAVAHYVYLAVENRGSIDLRRIDYHMDVGEGDLLFLPAVYDRRYVRDSGWRFLLREFDGLVA